MNRYVLVELDVEDMEDDDLDWIEEVKGAIYMETPLAMSDVRTADVTCFDGCQGLDFKSLTDLLS
jgi:hypothetical protein